MEHQYFGTRVTDDFEWLEDGKSAEVSAFTEAQNAYARKHLDALPERPAVRARVAQLLGASSADYLAVRPTAGSLFVLVTLGIGQSIVWASSLSYLGLGAVPPAAEWGAMLSAGRTYLTSFWWMTFFPGLFILISAVATTLVGRGLQERNRLS